MPRAVALGAAPAGKRACRVGAALVCGVRILRERTGSADDGDDVSLEWAVEKLRVSETKWRLDVGWQTDAIRPRQLAQH